MAFRFMVLKDDFYINETPLKGMFSVEEEGDAMIFVVNDISLKPEVQMLERYGMVRLVQSEGTDIDSADDVVRLTESVEMLEGGNVYLKVHLLGHDFTFTEMQLLSSMTLRRYLLRLGCFMNISRKSWEAIAQYWLDTAVKVHEVSDDQVLTEKVLNYLKRCTVYRDIDKVVSHLSLFYDPIEPNIVLCCTDAIVEYLQYDNRRKLRSVLSVYVDGPSAQKYVYSERKRFWRFLVDECDIDIDSQMAEGEDEDEL